MSKEKRIVYYDCEIINAIPIKNKPQESGIKYCEGWGDFAGMGISCICGYSADDQQWHVFTDGMPTYDRDPFEGRVGDIQCIDGLSSFDWLVDSADVLIGFNNHKFDDKLIQAHGLGSKLAKTPVVSKDLLAELWISMGLSLSAFTKFHGGSKLDDLARVNLPPEMRKTGDGALAPVDWQRGLKEKVIKYCLQDVAILRALVELAHEKGGLLHSNGTFYNMMSLLD